MRASFGGLILRPLRPLRHRGGHGGHSGGDRGHRGHSEGRSGAARALLLGVAALALGACGSRDAADLAVGVEPFDRLRGVNVAPLRSGMVRALRRAAVAAPLEGLRESIGAYDVLYGLTGFDGTDGAWPDEDAMVLFIEATREWPSDTSALGGWRAAMRELQAGLGLAPSCLEVRGPGFTMLVAEWDRGEGWSVSATYAPSDAARTPALTPRHSVAVRRRAVSAELPREGAPNPEERPTWAPASCTADAAAAPDASATGGAPDERTPGSSRGASRRLTSREPT